MRKFRTKRTIHAIVYSPITAGVLLILASVLAHAAWSAFSDYRLAHTNTLQTQQELRELQNREQTLTAAVEKMSTPRGVEDELRRKYGVAREGENVIVIVNSEEGGQAREKEGLAAQWWEGIKAFFSF